MAPSKYRRSYPFDRPGEYRIRVLGRVDESWSERIAGMSISSKSQGDQGTITTLVGTLHDQAELAGVLNTLYEWHMTLLSVDFLKTEN